MKCTYLFNIDFLTTSRNLALNLKKFTITVGESTRLDLKKYIIVNM